MVWLGYFRASHLCQFYQGIKWHKAVFELLYASSSYDPSEDGCAKPSTQSVYANQTEVEVDSFERIGENFSKIFDQIHPIETICIYIS